MAIKYILNTKAEPSVSGGGTKKWYASVITDGELTVEELSKQIEKFSSLSEADIRGVIIALENVIQENLINGKIIRMDKLGSFYPVINYNEVTENIKRSFIDALGELKVIPAASNYFIYGYLARVYITLPTCTMPDGGGTGGGGGGGDGGGTDPNCSEAYGSITGDEVSVNFASEVTEETVEKRTKYYEWKYLSSLLWYYASKEEGIHKKVGSEWQWESLKHDRVYRVGTVIGGTLSMTVNNSTPTVGIYNAGMTINYDFYGAAVCKGSPIDYSRPNVTANSPVWNCND